MILIWTYSNLFLPQNSPIALTLQPRTDTTL